MTYQFTNEWFLGNVKGSGIEVDIPATWRHLLQNRHVSKALEIGCYEGRSSVFLGEIFASRGPVELVCIDTWAGSPEHQGSDFAAVEQRFDANMAEAHQHFPWLMVRKIKAPSVNAMAMLVTTVEPAFDLAYIDGSHRAADVLSDAVMAFHLCKSGALMIFDDYRWTFGAERSGNPMDTPKPGIDAFLSGFAGKVNVLEGYPDYQLYCVKE